MDHKPFHTSDEEHQALHDAVDRSRSTSATVKVPREALVHLLMDHARLAQVMGEAA